MGITYIKIRNFKAARKIDYDFSRGKVNCLVGKNGVGKTTIDKAIIYFYEMAKKSYAMEDVIDKKNPYIQKASIEICFDFTKLFDCRESNDYLESVIDEIRPYMIDNKLAIKFYQFKNGGIKWWPISDRFIIEKVLRFFPVYMVQTKCVDINAWSELWDVVTDIAITGIKEDKNIVWGRLKDNFEKIYGSKYAKVIDIVDNAIKREQLSINERDFKKRFKNALMSNFGGEMFMFDDQRVDYYSDGINTLKYLSLLLKLLSELSTLSWKEVMIILDEPEISLHLQFIEELASVIVVAAAKVNFLIATHSTRLISTLLSETTDEFKVICNQVCVRNGYTYIRLISDIVKDKEKYLMRDNEAESYFADALVFVEGQTEIQLLKNKNIVKLFPKLKKVTIYNTNSNDSTTELIHPSYNNPAIPFLILIDMDKVLNYSKPKNRFYISKSNHVVNPLCNDSIKAKEKYLYYSSKKKATYIQRKKVQRYLEKEICANKFYNDSKIYDNLIMEVKKYCKAYRTIVFKTTIEGAIVCKESLNVFYEWLKNYWGDTEYGKYYQEVSGYDIYGQISIARGVFHGKTDYLFKFRKDMVPNAIFSIIKKYKSGDKVDGWVLAFFDWFFENYMDDTVENNEQTFRQFFPELYEVVQYINDMI